ncbi:hypothetical protein ACWEOE_36070 [Amycolatopsis sp. NPDC004368]
MPAALGLDGPGFTNVGDASIGLQVRATAVGVGTSVSRVGAAVGTVLTPILLYRIPGEPRAGWWQPERAAYANLHGMQLPRRRDPA